MPIEAPVAQWIKLLIWRLLVRDPLEAEIFPILNRAALHIAFRYHSPIVLIRLKYCQKGRKIASLPSIIVNRTYLRL